MDAPNYLGPAVAIRSSVSRNRARSMRFLATLAVILAAAAQSARAAEPVDVALVLVADVSRSIDDSEFTLEKQGYADAFRTSEVLSAIRGGPYGRIAVSYVEFAGSYEVRTVLDWTTINDDKSAAQFADNLLQASRSFWGRTAISAGIDKAVELIEEEGGPPATKKVIDVCGDGTNNAGREVADARNDAVKAGIVVNGLAIINDHPASWIYAHVQPPGGLVRYYQENVVGGVGSFVLEVHDFHSFRDAMVRKLVNEIAGETKGGHLASE